MKITTRSVRNEEIQEVAILADVESEVVPWGHKDRYRWQPVTIKTTVRRDRVNGGEWSRWDHGTVIMHGHNIRKDGSPGEPRSARLDTWDVRDSETITAWLAPYLAADAMAEPYFGPAEVPE